MLNKETVKNWLNKNNWLILKEHDYGDDSSFIYALSPTGLDIQFDFDKKGEYEKMHPASISTNV